MYFSTSVPMLISRQFGDEIVLANYESGIYYNLGGTGAQIWQGLAAGKSVDEIVGGFAAGSADRLTVDGDVRRFVDHLVAEGIIVPSDRAAAVDDWLPSLSDGFAAPVLERFDDLRDLLLVDPIHDVGEAGWPLRSGDAG